MQGKAAGHGWSDERRRYTRPWYLIRRDVRGIEGFRSKENNVLSKQQALRRVKDAITIARGPRGAVRRKRNSINTHESLADHASSSRSRFVPALSEDGAGDADAEWC